MVIKIAGAGLCHSDEHLMTGDMLPDPSMAPMVFPMVGGHEAAGEVVDVGPGVRSVAVGDHVVLSFIPACGRCPSCAKGQQHLCDMGAYALTGRQITDMTARHHDHEGNDLGIMCCIGTFAEYTVVNEASCVKIDNWMNLETASLIGCGVTTGWGSAVYAADVTPGDTVVVIGLGGIGMNAVQGARIAGARYIVAVDPVSWKRDAAEQFGATHAAESIEAAMAIVSKITWGANADKAILTTGVATGDLIAPMLALVAKGGRVRRHRHRPDGADEDRHQPLGPHDEPQGAHREHLRQRQPPSRHPPPAPPLRGGQAPPRRAHHHPLQARRHQPGLPGHARRQEPPRPHHLLVKRRRRWLVAILIAIVVALSAAAGFWYVFVPHWRPALRDGEHYGIDVSAHQGDIDWDRVADDEIDFAYIKASEGRDFPDQQFDENWAEAGLAGLERGAYHFFTLCSSGADQAEYFLRIAPPDDDALPPAVDLELAGNCHDRPSVAAVSGHVDDFVEAVEAAWHRPVVLYIGDDWDRAYPTRERAGRYLWHRRFLRRPNVDAWKIWQIHGYAKVEGVDGGVDLDIMRD